MQHHTQEIGSVQTRKAVDRSLEAIYRRCFHRYSIPSGQVILGADQAGNHGNGEHFVQTGLISSLDQYVRYEMSTAFDTIVPAIIDLDLNKYTPNYEQDIVHSLCYALEMNFPNYSILYRIRVLPRIKISLSCIYDSDRFQDAVQKRGLLRLDEFQSSDKFITMILKSSK